MKVKIAVAGITSTQKRIQMVKAASKSAPKALVRQIALLLRRQLKASAPKKTGRLAASIGFRVTPTATGAIATFHAVDYAKYVLGGTRPHEIWAGIYTGKSTKKALWWPGARHATPYVQHPGTKANDFVSRSYKASRPDISSMVKRGGTSILRGIPVEAA